MWVRWDCIVPLWNLLEKWHHNISLLSSPICEKAPSWDSLRASATISPLLPANVLADQGSKHKTFCSNCCCCFFASDAASVQGRQLLAGLEKVNSELDKQEKAITANLRPPLEQSRAVQDSAERSKDLKVKSLPTPKSILQWVDRMAIGCPYHCKSQVRGIPLLNADRNLPLR